MDKGIAAPLRAVCERLSGYVRQGGEQGTQGIQTNGLSGQDKNGGPVSHPPSENERQERQKAQTQFNEKISP